MTGLALRETDLRELYFEVERAPATLGDMAIAHAPRGETLILVELGPHQNPSRIQIHRSRWPTVTTLNHSEGAEFHMRLRRHSATGIYLVYGSVTLPNMQVRQRGHLCRTLEAVERVIPLLRQELDIKRSGQITK